MRWMGLCVLAAVFAGCAARQGAVTVSRATGTGSATMENGLAVFTVLDQETGRIDRRLFGQFMERPSWGETGPEGALVPGTGKLLPAVVDILREMRIPIVRFPGGTDVDYLDWRDMGDNIPGREGGRPVSTGHKGDKVTNRFGYDEFLRLAEELRWQVIVVVNLREALLGIKPVSEAARDAAGLVAYCAVAPGAKLPAGMPDWPGLRARNGHAAPYRVDYVQLGNETWAFREKMRELHGDRMEDFYAECVAAYEEAIHAVSPGVRLIADYDESIAPKIANRLGKRLACFCGHYYVPWTIQRVLKDGVEVPRESLTAEDIWRAWVTTPRIDAEGCAVVDSKVLRGSPALGYPVAVTEWNWNGGWGHQPGQVALRSLFARGVGAAGFLHAFMRHGSDIVLGNQSMLVGTGWGIAAVKVDKAGARQPVMNPSGMVTMLYSQHHGDRLMAMKEAGVPSYRQPFEMGGIKPSPKVLEIDAVATADGKTVYWHAINRSFDRPLPVTVDMSALGVRSGRARLHLMEGRLDDAGEGPVARLREESVRVTKGVARFDLPARCVVVLEAPRAARRVSAVSG